MAKSPSSGAKNVVKNLTAIRTRWGLSVPKMAMAAGVAANSLVRWEDATRGARTESLDVIARGLDLTASQLLADDVPPVDDIAPAFGFAVIADDAADDLIESVQVAVRAANRAYRDRKRLAASVRPVSRIPSVGVVDLEEMPFPEDEPQQAKAASPDKTKRGVKKR